MKYALFFALAIPDLAISSPAGAVAMALADAKALPSGIREKTRYLTLFHFPKNELVNARKILSFHANSLSREPEIVIPRQVADTLFAIVLDEYGWSKETWERFAESDPYFHVLIEIPEVQELGFWQGEKWLKTRDVKTGKIIRIPASAPWLDVKEIAELINLTQSQCPILRADWFIIQTAIQEGRKVGYYDMLGLGKNRDGFETLVGFDRKHAIALGKEIGSVVASSSVALNNRQLFRFQAITGAYWESRDVRDNRDAHNALRMLNGDYKHEVEEIFGTLPNGLFAVFLSNEKGTRADYVPPEIAADGTSTGSDRRVHVGLSCVRCHVEGIRPIDCWARRTYSNDIILSSHDPAKTRRLKRLYLSDINSLIRRDQQDYATVLKTVNGLTTKENADIYASFWSRYVDQPRTIEDVERETGYSRQQIIAALRERRNADPILLGLAKENPQSIRSEHWEEAFSILMGYIREK